MLLSKAGIGLSTALVCCGLLLYEYPWSIEVQFGAPYQAYFVVSLLMGWAAWLVNLVPGEKSRPAAGQGIICGGILFVGSIGGAIALGPGGFEIPGAHLSIFFMEFLFLNFIGYVALPTCLFAAVISAFVSRSIHGAWVNGRRVK